MDVSMWKCKHCTEVFQFKTPSEKGNHSRWCLKNPDRNNWNTRKMVDSRLGAIREHVVTCSTCEKLIVVEERGELPRKESYFCSRSCANSRGGKKKAEMYHGDDTANYRVVCFRHHEKRCIVCGEENIVAVHHEDFNHTNNNPANLIPLCPTHHQYVHSSFRGEVQPTIDIYVKEFNKKLGV